MRRVTPRARRPLSVYRPEHRNNPAAFARKFARDAYAGATGPLVHVLDDYQESGSALDLVKARDFTPPDGAGSVCARSAKGPRSVMVVGNCAG